MKRILYANGSVLTSDRIADAVVRYATALAGANAADNIRFPVVKDGQPGFVEMLIGPASELMVEEAGDDPDAGFDEADFLADLVVRGERISHPPTIKPGASRTEDLSAFDDI